jgi:hypothetical protein
MESVGFTHMNTCELQNAGHTVAKTHHNEYVEGSGVMDFGQIPSAVQANRAERQEGSNSYRIGNGINSSPT